ncbi:MAG: HD domain-containing phosphohydrolase [Planctomycetota bacterium]|jgi:putative nucleotidyltransferase with HDIG domain
MPRVRIKTGPNQGLVHNIADETLTLGRDTECTIQILDKGASRRHAEIFRIGEMCFIRDLGSRNGTYVNDEKVGEELLREGDRIQIGSTVLVFESTAQVSGETKGIKFTEASEEDFGQTLELRLDDLAGFDEAEKPEGRDTANFRALYRVGKMISAERDEVALMNKVLKFLAGELPADNLYLFTRDDKTNNLVAKARLELENTGAAPVSRTIIRRCIAEQRSILTSDAALDARFKTGDSIILNRIRSVLCVPLVSQERIRGVLYLCSSRVGQSFVEEDLELATAVGTQVGIALENLYATRKQRETFFSAIRTLVAVAEMRDPGSVGHSERVATYASAIAETMNLPERQRTTVHLAALLHDIGKAAISDQASRRDTRMNLGPGEGGEEHVRLGVELARNIGGAENVIPAIESHHERHDGTGYPDGLKSSEIPLEARVVGLANVFDRMLTAGGEDSQGVTMKEALVTVGKLAGKEFDPEVVKGLLVSYRNGTLFKAKTIFDLDVDGKSADPLADTTEKKAAAARTASRSAKPAGDSAKASSGSERRGDTRRSKPPKAKPVSERPAPKKGSSRAPSGESDRSDASDRATGPEKEG